MVYNSLYMPSLVYGMSATWLIFKECTDLQKPAVNTILLKMGINKHDSCVIIFTRSKYGGLELDHLAVVQGFGWLQYIMVHLRCQGGTGTLMKTLVEFTQLECVCLTPVFELDHEEYMTTILTRN
jgi:hypothetical protein